jgi:hypothetical protein
MALLLCVLPVVPAEAVGIDPSAAAATTPKPTAETIDSNRLENEEGKNTPDVFVRKETVSSGRGVRHQLAAVVHSLLVQYTTTGSLGGT